MQAPVGPLQLLTAAEVGSILHRHPAVVRRLARAGQIGSVRLGSRGVRFRVADVQRYVERHAIAAQVESSRKAQGLPPTVEDPTVLGAIAGMVVQLEKKGRTPDEGPGLNDSPMQAANRGTS